MNRATKSLLRADLFRHLDGIVTAPTAYVLHEYGVLTYLLEQQQTSLEELTVRFHANEGYLNIASASFGFTGLARV